MKKMSEEIKPFLDNPEEKVAKERDALIAALSSGKRDSVLERVGHLLNQYPDLRDSDIQLQLKYWETYESELYDSEYIDIKNYGKLTHLNSITRARARIQNTLNLFQASFEVKKHRGKLQDDEVDRARRAKDICPCYTVFMDESGKNDKNLILGSVWFLDSNSFGNITKELLLWQNQNDIKWEFHFQKLTESNYATYYRFVDFFCSRNPILSFRSIRVENKGFKNTNDALCKMTYLLLEKGVKQEITTGRATLPRSLQLYKDSEEMGSDKLYLEEVRTKMENVSQIQFEGKLNVEDFVAISSNANPIMQIADLFVASLNRKVNNPGTGSNVKDKFAEYFLGAIKSEVKTEETESDAIFMIAL
jgi:Protein of unknown function (DUF3800)